MDDTPAAEMDIPHYALWDDGSEYEVFWNPAEEEVRSVTRRWHGPLFGATEWHTEIEVLY